MTERTHRFPRDGVDPFVTLKPLAFFPSDPTVHLDRHEFERATWSPSGPAVVSITWDEQEIRATVRGDGKEPIVERLPLLLGLDDDISSFPVGHHQLVDRLWRTFAGLRIGASHTLWHDAAWLVPGQRVATVDAARQWAEFVRSLGSDAPGTARVMLPPSADEVAKLPYHALHHCGIERRRAMTMITGARRLPRLSDMTDRPDDLRAAVERIPGFGPWMSTNIATMTCGAADEVVLRDYGQPSYVSWALAGERRGTDERMLELLEPFRGNRYRVIRLLHAGGVHAPRRGHRRPLRKW